VIETVLYGGDGFCLLEPLQTYSTATAELLHRLQTIVAHHQTAQYATDDVVHIDFNPTNILVHNGAISGIIDWHDPQAGDATFDLVTLVFYSWDTPAVRDQLWQHILARISPTVLSVYLAHMILRQVDWSIRHHGPQATTRWMRIAQESLAWCAAAQRS
jgi:aminoglycoside phosphotransferase (APT) family kinase protein